MKCECGGALRFTNCITGHEVWKCAFCGRETLIEEDSGPDRCISPLIETNATPPETAFGDRDRTVPYESR